jgi:hypothetical protein
MQRVHYGFEYTGPLDSFRLVPDVKLPKEVILERLGHILCGVSIMPARVEEYDAAHPPPEVSGNLLRVLLGSCTSYSVFDFFLLLLQGFGRAFRLEVAVIIAGEVAAEEPTEGDEDDDVVAGPVVVAATGSGSSSARLSTGLFEGQHSYVEYVPDPRIAQYILLSRKRWTEVASKQSLPKRRCSTHQHPVTPGFKDKTRHTPYVK